MSAKAMNKMAKKVEKMLPKDFGFTIIVFPFHELDVSNYISNAKREDMIKVLIIDAERCTGCRACEVACSLHKTHTCNPARSRVSVVKWEEAGIMVPVMCQHCQEPPCALICPTNAIKKNKQHDPPSVGLALGQTITAKAKPATKTTRRKKA